MTRGIKSDTGVAATAGRGNASQRHKGADVGAFAVPASGLNDGALQEATNALTALGKRSAEIADRFADDIPYQRERVVAEAKFLMEHGARAMLEAGKRLIQLKENEPWGEFAAIVEQQFGFSTRTAQRMMAAAAKYLSPQLASKRTLVSALNSSKLFDLMSESDDDLAELAEGGTLAGKTLDEFAAMTRLELQAAVKDWRHKAEARQRLLDKANAKADRLAKPYLPSDEDVAKTAEENALLLGVSDAITRAQAALQDLGVILSDLDNSSASKAVRAAAHTNVEYLSQRLAQLIIDHGIPVQFEDEVMPSWVTAAKAKLQKNV